MNMMQMSIQGADKIDAPLQQEPKPLNVRSGKRDGNAFEQMLDALKEPHKMDKDINALRGGDDAPSKVQEKENTPSDKRDGIDVAKGEEDGAEIAKAEKGKADCTEAKDVKDTAQTPKHDGMKAKIDKDDAGNALAKKGAKNAQIAAAHKGAPKTASVQNGAKDEGKTQSVRTALSRKKAANDAHNEVNDSKSKTAKDSAKTIALKKGDGQKEERAAGESAKSTAEENAAVINIKVQKIAAHDADSQEDNSALKAASAATANKTNAAPVKGEKDAPSNKIGKALKKKTLDKDEKISVVDLRSEGDKARVNEAKDSKETAAEVGKIKAGMGEAQAAGAMAEAKENITASSTQAAAADGSTFQAMVENQIRENTPEIVKTGTLLLRDNNAGTINLVMHPENLGNVRIVLHLADNTISGQITVHSREAYDAFKNSAPSLSQAFNDSGFNSQGFNVAYSGAGDGQSAGRGAQEQQAQFTLASGRAERGYEGTAAMATDGSVYGGDYSVNIVA